MAAQKRKQNPSVRQTLMEEGCRFNFFKAVHLLEGYAGGRAPGRGLSPRGEFLRFRVRPGFSFPASDVQCIRNGDKSAGTEMTVNFMGLIGPKGVLPDWYNEHAQHQVYRKDYAFTDFLDMFHHRLLSLFYQAWKKYRLAENFRVDGNDRISRSLADLTGMTPEDRQQDPRFYKYARNRLIFFAGMAARCVPTAAAIKAVVSHAVGAPAEVEQFVPRMLPVHAHDRTCLGRNNSTLQKNAMCGARVRDIGTYFIVRLGPLTWEKYLAFQPRSRNLALVHQLVGRLAGMEYEFEIQLIVKGPEVPGLCLGGSQGAPVLGRTVLLRNPGRSLHRDIAVRNRRDN